MSSNSSARSEQNGPVGQGDYEVQQGDCLVSIAVRFGFNWETLWNLPENMELKQVRKDPNVLMPGDRITIPGIRIKEQDGATNKRHRFVLKGVPAKFVMRFYEDGEPRSGESYTLIVDGSLRTGSLDSDGQLTEWIPPHARTGTLILEGDETIPLVFGSLDPVQTVSGAQGRLRNLGFAPGPIDGIWGPQTEAAIRQFQTVQNLEITGEIDGATRDKLVQVHGS